MEHPFGGATICIDQTYASPAAQDVCRQIAVAGRKADGTPLTAADAHVSLLAAAHAAHTGETALTAVLTVAFPGAEFQFRRYDAARDPDPILLMTRF